MIKQVSRHYLCLFQKFSCLRTGSCVAIGPAIKEPVAQFVVPECYVPAVLNLVHDMVVTGHPGRERTLAAARTVYFWPTMRRY